jgi:hypothetical protein
MTPLLIPLVAGLLPSLVKYLLPDSPAAAIATGAVGGALQAITGTRDPAQAATVLAAEPGKRAELIQALARIEAEREAEQRRAALETLRVEMAGVADARARDVAIQAGGSRNVRADVMVVLVIVAITAGMAFLYYADIRPGSAIEGAILGLIGGMAKCFFDAFQFEFGSSRGSADKSVTLARELEARPVAAPQQQPTAVATTGTVTVNSQAPMVEEDDRFREPTADELMARYRNPQRMTP